MATPNGELVCAKCYMEYGPVTDLLCRKCFFPVPHQNEPRLVVPLVQLGRSPPVGQSSFKASEGAGRAPRVRPVPPIPVFRFRLCEWRPPRTCRRGDLCTYPHNEEELRVWNEAKNRKSHGFPRPPQAPSTIKTPDFVRGQKPPHMPTVSPMTSHQHYKQRRQLKYSSFFERVKEKLYIEEIQRDLTVTNYKDKFHKLLCWEEKEHITLLHNRCDGFYSLKMLPKNSIPDAIQWKSMLPNKDYGYLEVGDGDVIAYATQASEAVYLIAPDGREVKAEILVDNFHHTGNNLYICFDRGSNVCNNEGVETQFEVKHSFFDGLHRALDNLPDDVVRRLVPKSNDFTGQVMPEGLSALRSIPEEYVNILNLQNIEDDYQQALQVALSCQPNAPPVLITGPFGSGKTCFLACVAYLFLSEAKRYQTPARILICAHHQATADTIMENYFGPMLEHKTTPLKVEVVRVTSSRATHATGRMYDMWYCNMADFTDEAENYKHLPKLVVITTFLTSLRLKHSFKPGFFTHILIDEGAQAREPETIASLCLANSMTKIIIAGDPKQVGPSLLVLGEEAQENGLKASLLERLQSHYKMAGDKAAVLKATLQTNFRCHECIVSFASRLFYKSSVRTSQKCKRIQPHPDFPYPLVFVCSSREEISSYESSVNEIEASLLLKKFMELSTCLQSATRSNICVLSSSRGQVTTLRKLRDKERNCPKSLRILPTFHIQGQEYHSLYISTCEPTWEDGNTRNPTKSICDPFVFNTAITRAKSLIVSFGNPFLLLATEKHMVQKYGSTGKCWSEYMMRCLLNGTFIVPDSVIKSLSDKGKYKQKLMQTLEGCGSDKGKSAPGNQPPTAIKAGPKTTGSLLSQARTENNPVLERTNLPQSTSPKAAKHDFRNTPATMVTTAENHDDYHVVQLSRGVLVRVWEDVGATPKTTIQSLNPVEVSHKHKISVQSVCNTPAYAQSPPGPRVQPQGANNKLTTLSCAPASSSNGRGSHGVATARPNVPGSSLRSGHSVPKFSMLVSPSTNQVSSSTLKDKSKAQMVSKNVHMSASRSSQGFPNAKSTTRSQTTHNEQTNVSAPGSATSLSNRKRQHPYGCSKQETTKAAMCSSSSIFSSSDFPSLDESKSIKMKKRDLPTPPVPQVRVRMQQSSSEHTEAYRYKQSIDIVSKPLSIQNYKDKFHHLLYLEEEEHCDILAKKCNGIYSVTVSKQKFPEWLTMRNREECSCYGTITSNDDDILSYAQQAAESAHIFLGDRVKIYVNFVTSGLYNGSIVVGLSQKALDVMAKWRGTGGRVGVYQFETYVEFELKHSYFQRQHKALKCLPHFVIQKILPNIKANKQHGPFVMESDDPMLKLDTTGQVQALRAILSNNTRTPIIVAGPFGTGKTRVLARAAFELLTRNQYNQPKILICAHHQASADTFIEYFGKLQRRGIFSKSFVIFRVTTTGYHSKIKNEYPEYFITTSDPCSHITVSTLGLSQYMHNIRPLTHIFIDEAAQTRETEAIMPLTLAEHNTKIVIAGDHCQVGPDLLVLGEEARKHGFSISLLQRLHEQYQKIGETTNSLLTNYRSHSGLLMLPSSLFYGSTLQCRVPDSKSHPLAPYPLVFVCSSIKNSTTCKIGSTDKTEATVLVEQVKKYIADSWPTTVWGSQYDPPGKVCVMTPSPAQKKLIDKMMKNFDLQQTIQVLKAYEIQGREFTAVFIGTCEATDENGLPTNLTKTVMNRYVFNTALTRAQYLVVAVGNPLILLEKEEIMCRKYPEHERYQCWKEYIRRCIECKTFHLRSASSKSEVDDFTKLLYEKVFGLTDLCTNFRPLESKSSNGREDSILSAYKKKFESIPECRKSKLTLSRVQGGDLVWQMRDEAAMTESDEHECKDEYAETYDCKLNVLFYHKAEGIPLDSSKRVVQIHGAGNRRGAFHEDIVKVGVFNGQVPGKCYGKVLAVVKRQHKQNLVCKAHKYNPVLFCPLSKKYPLLLNLPRLSKDLLAKKDMASIDAELKSKDVAVFDSQSLSNSDIPQITNVIPHSVAHNMLFVVRILQWNPKYRLPLGIVIHALPKGFSGFHAERILMIVHEVQYDTDGDHITATSSQTAKPKAINGNVDTRAFTIDPPDAVNLDDALSLTRVSSSTYQLAVHIVNTNKLIKDGGKVDCEARARGTSVYNGSQGRMMNMLPAHIRSQLSLLPGQVCDVLSIIGMVKVGGSIDHISIRETQVRSCAKLSYMSAQDIMDNTFDSTSDPEVAKWIENYNSEKSQPSLKETLSLLYKVAMKLRSDRLGSLAALSYDIHESGEEECWQTHLLVEELMVWANNVISNRLFTVYPECALLRKQSAPNIEEVAAVTSQHGLVIRHSHSLAQCVQHQSLPQNPLVFTMKTIQAVYQAMQARNMKLLFHLLTSDYLYPQLSVCGVHFRRLQQKAEYCCTSSDEDPSSYHHHSLQLESYTHFTSPLRRYADIVVQRMVRSVIGGVGCPYKHEDIKSMCQKLNAATGNAKSFEKGMNSLNLALKYSQSSEVYEVFITSNTGNDIEIYFPQRELKDIPLYQKKVSVRNLKCRVSKQLASGQSANHSPESNVYLWNLKLISLENPSFLFEHEDLFCVRPDSAARDSEDLHSAVLSLPHIGVKLFEPLQELSMLKTVPYHVNVSPMAVAISPKEWSKFTHFIQHPSEKGSEELQMFLGTKILPCKKQASDIREHSSPFIKCNVSCRMGMYDITRVWMTWSTREAILAPQMQIIEVAPFFRICLQHNAHPAECFSDVHLQSASRDKYTDLKQYVGLWEKVLLAEAAERSVDDSQIGILFDVTLKWPKLVIPKNCLDEVHYEPNGCFELVLPQNVVQDSAPFLKVHIGDMMCVRYGTKKNSNVRAVFHMVVSAKKKSKPSTNSGITLLLKVISAENCRISDKMLSLIKEKCEVQVITMSPSYQRVYKGLMNLQGDDASELAVHVALGDDKQLIRKAPNCPVDITNFKRDSFATCLWSNYGIPLNRFQCSAMELALKRRFQLIQGPPGTGKSETGAHLAYTFAMSNRVKSPESCVLYCGPTNKAVDVVLEKLHQLQNLKILRIYGHAVETREFPGPYNEKTTFQISDSDYRRPHWARQYSLHCMIRDSRSELAKGLKEMEALFRAENVKGHIPNAKMCKEWKQLVSTAEKDILQKRFDIILCTCNEASSDRIVKVKPQQCIIDESGMAYEPETIVPISLCEHVVLLGDHKQLQPVIEYKSARENGLTTSLFQRYAESRKENICVMLKVQYRMHKEICQFPSECFYGNRLQTAPSVIERTNPETRLSIWPRGPKYPIVFCDIVGQEENQPNRSKCNPAEARHVIKIAKVLHEVYRVDLSQIALLTPYANQKSKINDLATEARLTGSDRQAGVTVATITESQGDEYGIVILSTVRSQPLADIRNEDHVQPDRSWLLENLGFLTDEHQINVGITRSKYGLIIVGNKTLLRFDNTWKALISHYEKKRCVVFASQFPSEKDLLNLL